MMGCMEYVIRNMEYGKNQVSPVILNSNHNPMNKTEVIS